ncbi:MAG TPA: FAD-dependent monooxygenase [Pseudolabrys sp.]|jgi:3-(3-hydroxy-phenyl)propionate hydroxylase|nr:FAD-dependent monooxygenase [Pseudolabrys sp.]
MSLEQRRVLIAGGGPVGLLAALLLGRQGLPVRLFDVNETPQADPRAATTHPATLDLLAEDGLADDMARVGLVAPIFQFWDRPSGEKIAEFDHAVLQHDTRHAFVVQCEQFKTAKLILERVRKLRNVEVLFGHEVLDITQTSGSISVDVSGPDGIKTHAGAYLIGADGGRSVVRKQSDIAFDGFTWPERFIVLTTPFDFEAARGLCFRSYFADPDEWCNCFKVSADGSPGLWRTVFPANPGLSEGELMSDAAVQERMQKFFPASRPYEIVHRNLYVTHQRVAATFRKGRVLLAGDSAHVNNPIGGMGLNGGIQDAANLADKLAPVLLAGAPDALLDLYSLQRRTVATEYVQEQSITNKKRLEARDPEMRRRNHDELREIASDPSRARQFLLRTSMIASQRRVAAMTLAEA